MVPSTHIHTNHKITNYITTTACYAIWLNGRGQLFLQCLTPLVTLAKRERSVVFAVFDSVCLNGRSYLAKRERSMMIVFAVFDSVCLNGRSYLAKHERSTMVVFAVFDSVCLSGRSLSG